MEAHLERRNSVKQNLNMIVLWASAITALWVGLSAASKIQTAIETAPKTVARVDVLERTVDEQGDDIDDIKWWVSRMGEKAGVPTPPPHRRRHAVPRPE